MDANLFEQLLHEEEGPALDFKRDQYKFAKASEEEKSELLKDILGFANTFRRADAYILIGVEDVPGGKGNVIGVSEQLQDHSVQQFVNQITNRPVRFQCEAFTYSGLPVGIIRVELQERPFYPKRDYGKLRRDQVYVRRGSSTDPTTPATPDEIAQMGRHGMWDRSGQTSPLSSLTQKRTYGLERTHPGRLSMFDYDRPTNFPPTGAIRVQI